MHIDALAWSTVKKYAETEERNAACGTGSSPETLLRRRKPVEAPPSGRMPRLPLALSPLIMYSLSLTWQV